MTSTSATSPKLATRLRRSLTLGLLAVVAGSAVVACASEGSSKIADGTSLVDNTSTTLVEDVDAGTDDSADSGPSGNSQVGGGAGQPASASGSSTGAGSSNGNGQSAPRPPAAGPAPVITMFWTPDNIDCHNGSFQYFTAEWTTTNAVRTTVSIDGPGIYDTYGPNAEVSLPFNCSSPHTFLLTAYGADGQTATKSITLHPRNVQTPLQEDVEEL